MTPGGPRIETADDGGEPVPHVPLLEDALDASRAEPSRSAGASAHGLRSATTQAVAPGTSAPVDMQEPPAEVKPTWRGWIHAGTFPLAIVLGVILIVLADGVAAKVSSAIFVLSALLLFGNSALYHRLNWKPRTSVLLKRIDHANIFLLIAGSYTPLTVLCLTQPHADDPAVDHLGRSGTRRALPCLLHPRAALALCAAVCPARMGCAASSSSTSSMRTRSP